MAGYRVIHWREIPSVVEAFDVGGTVRVPLSQRFQDLIDALAMRIGASESEAYLAGWAEGLEAERPGSPETVAGQVVAELEAGFEELVARRLLTPPA